MITDKNLFNLLKKAPAICHFYDKEMDKLAQINGGRYNFNEDVQLQIANKAFNIVLKQSTINVSWDECAAIFDIIHRNS